jgi:RNA polymerase sigma factor (TIGR02999 family)
MADAVSQPVSELLGRCQAGDEESFRKLLAAAYPELRRLAHYHLRGERPNHTLQSTALVHEAYVRLLKTEPTDFQNRAHFFGACSQLMRQILVDYARARCAVKRERGYLLTLDRDTVYADVREVDLITLDDALSRLAKLDPRQSKIVELRFFGWTLDRGDR